MKIKFKLVTAGLFLIVLPVTALIVTQKAWHENSVDAAISLGVLLDSIGGGFENFIQLYLHLKKMHDTN